MFARVKIRTLRQLKLPLGVTRLPASAVRDLLKRSDRQPKKSKYGAVRTTAPDGREFHSAREAERYWQLCMMERGGEIADLELQPAYHLHANGMRIGEYRADFRYKLVKTGEIVVEDSKGFRTDLFRWKKKHTEAEYGIRVVEV